MKTEKTRSTAKSSTEGLNSEQSPRPGPVQARLKAVWILVQKAWKEVRERLRAKRLRALWAHLTSLLASTPIIGPIIGKYISEGEGSPDQGGPQHEAPGEVELTCDSVAPVPTLPPPPSPRELIPLAEDFDR
mgnify:CR=1 FL=1